MSTKDDKPHEKEQCNYRGLLFRCRKRLIPGETLCKYHSAKEAQQASEEAAYKQRVEKAGSLKVPTTFDEKIKASYLRKGYCIFQSEINGIDKWIWGETAVCDKKVAPGSPLCPKHTKANFAIVEQEQKQKIEEEQQRLKLRLEEERRRNEYHQLQVMADSLRTVASHWQHLSGKEFEQEFAALLRRYGYEISQLSSGSDRGIDIAAVRDGKKVVVQCKATQGPVSESTVRDLYGTMVSEGVDKAILASISGFSQNTRDFAKGKPIELIDLEQMIKMSVNVTSYNPEMAQHHYSSGISLLKNNKAEEAISEFQKAIRLKPDYVEAHIKLGQGYCLKNFYDLAINQFEEAIKLEPKHVEAHYWLGLAYGWKGINELAIQHLEEAIKLKPDDVSVLSNLGHEYIKKGLYDTAINYLKEAIRLDPDDAYAHFKLGVAYDGKGLCDLAIEHLEDSILLEPDNAMVHKLLALRYFDKGMHSLAIKHAERGVEINPNDVTAYELLDMLYRLRE